MLLLIKNKIIDIFFWDLNALLMTDLAILEIIHIRMAFLITDYIMDNMALKSMCTVPILPIFSIAHERYTP